MFTLLIIVIMTTIMRFYNFGTESSVALWLERQTLGPRG